MKKITVGIAMLVSATSAFAQTIPSSEPTASVGETQLVVELSPAQPTKLTQGTEVSLRLLRELTTKGKELKVGDRFDLELVDPLKLGTVTVIPAGSRAFGEIMSVRNKGMWGKSGKFDARLMHLRAGDRLIRLAGTFDDKGVQGGWGAAAASVLIVPVLGFFMTGTSAKVEAGTIIKGILDEDVQFSVSETPTSAPPETPASAPPKDNLNASVERFEEAKRQCSELGFKSASPAFGKCVLQLSR